MTEKIIESIGDWGIITNHSSVMIRHTHPRSGDIVSLTNHPDLYKNKLGRIDTVDFLGIDGLIHMCENLGSAFLFKNGNVDISGGPFDLFHTSSLEPTYRCIWATYWNCGDNMPGGDKGVTIKLYRPLYQLKSKIARVNLQTGEIIQDDKPI